MKTLRKNSKSKPATTASTSNRSSRSKNRAAIASAAPLTPAGSEMQITRIALLGFGTVGASVAKALATLKLPGLELTHIFNRNVARKRDCEAAQCVPSSVVWTEDIDDILSSDVQVVVELMGGLTPTEGWLRKVLSSGKSVVTANKQLIAYRGPSLARLAAQHNAQLVYGAAVAGGVPVIPGMLQGLGGDRITRLSGILNGTCNYILTRMEAGADYATVLADAQQLGYAEADPSADVDGYDARAKLVILTRLGLHADVDPEAVSTQSISGINAVDFTYARELNCTIRQISRSEIDGATVRARVAPMLVPLSSPIAWSHGTLNMVVANGVFGGDTVFSGHGAGGGPTAVAVVSDILAVAQGCKAVRLPTRKRTVTGEFHAPHYCRFIVDDKPGIISSFSGALATYGINIDSILQRPGHPKHRLPFVVTVEPCMTSTLNKALATIAKMDFILEPPLCLQMLAIEDKD